MKKLPRDARAVVTGGGSGLGQAICYDLAGRGARVLVTDVKLATAEETAETLRRRGSEAHAMQVDVRKPEQVEAMARKAAELWGGTDVLVNNAGLAVVGELGKIPVEEWQYQVDVNLMGVIWGCHYFGPDMARRGSGFILNVASSAGLLAAPMMGPYNVTKAGVIALSETLFAEIGPAGVTVSALCPTFLRTNIHKDARSFGGGTGEKTDKLVTQAKWSAEEVARVAIDELLAGKLYIIPQTDGKVLWRAKRALGQNFYAAIRAALKRGGLEAVLKLERFSEGSGKGTSPPQPPSPWRAEGELPKPKCKRLQGAGRGEHHPNDVGPKSTEELGAAVAAWMSQLSNLPRSRQASTPAR